MVNSGEGCGHLGIHKSLIIFLCRYIENSSRSCVSDNVKMFQQLRECFDLVGFREDVRMLIVCLSVCLLLYTIQEQYSILVCLAAILHLGNIEVKETDHGFATVDLDDPSLSAAAVRLNTHQIVIICSALLTGSSRCRP